MSSWVYRADAEVPSYTVLWRDSSNVPIDFSTGYTFEVKLVNRSSGAVALTKTTGITGSDGSSGYNIVVAWSVGELNVTPGIYEVHLTATTETADRHFRPGHEPQIVIKASV